MIWLASYPRSGNTFLRIVLHEVYGIPSSAFHREPNQKLIPGYDRYEFVKTHLRPHQLVPEDPNIPAVYLIRDGRDTVVSMAHQRADMIAPGSDYYENLREAIMAAGDSHFGGWSKHVSEWLKRASIVIRFEELIESPIECIERLRSIYTLPEPDITRLPTFQDLRAKDYAYSTTRKPELKEERRQKFFRRGKTGSWRDEMPEELHRLFLNLHGDVLKELGYFHESDLKECSANPDRAAEGSSISAEQHIHSARGAGSGEAGSEEVAQRSSSTIVPAEIGTKSQLTKISARSLRNGILQFIAVRNKDGLDALTRSLSGSLECVKGAVSHLRSLVDGSGSKAGIPDYVIVGGRNCGEKALIRLIEEHPGAQPCGILVGEKRQPFFHLHYDKGLEWYRSQFDRKNGLVGDASPHYILQQKAAWRLREANPEVKILMIFRDPVERAFLHHQKLLDGSGPDTGLSFKERISADMRQLEGIDQSVVHQELANNVLYGGLYAHQYDFWRNRFGKDKVLVIQWEQLRDDPQACMDRVFAFLELPKLTIRRHPKGRAGAQASMAPETKELIQSFFKLPNRELERSVGITWEY